MNRLVCEDCGAIFYSAAARTMAEQGRRCEICGGPLVWIRDRPPDDHVGVGPGGGASAPDHRPPDRHVRDEPRR